MGSSLLLAVIAVVSSYFTSIPPQVLTQNPVTHANPGAKQLHFLIKNSQFKRSNIYTFDQIESMLQREGHSLNRAVSNKVLASLKCARQNGVLHNNILAVIDYSLPSSEKRLWVFDLQKKKLLFHTYVSHGINSGALLSNAFSNQWDSKASSIGVFRTDEAYYGREGLSLRLTGLERGFNDNASRRYIVMHGGWYVEEDFIKRYGRAGRSWGCPAVPLELAKPIINTIKDHALFVVYYPSDNWFMKSRFLNCSNFSAIPEEDKVLTEINPPMVEKQGRESILFVDRNNNGSREESEPVVVISAGNYERIFNSKPPVERMLRRQINGVEYIAISPNELKDIIAGNHLIDLNFVIPVVTMERGYYLTHMQLVPLGFIKQVRINTEALSTPYSIDFANGSSHNLRAIDYFIRWVGL